MTQHENLFRVKKLHKAEKMETDLQEASTSQGSLTHNPSGNHEIGYKFQTWYSENNSLISNSLLEKQRLITSTPQNDSTPTIPTDIQQTNLEKPITTSKVVESLNRNQIKSILGGVF